MSTVFDVPCPECGQPMPVTGRGELECPTCGRTYTARLGHLFLVGEPIGPPGRGSSRPAATAP
jgi:hypothetical protein